MARLIELNGSTGIEIQGIIVDFANYDYGQGSIKPVPNSGMFVNAIIQWRKNVQLVNFIAAFSTSSLSQTTKSSQVLVTIPGFGSLSLSYIMLPRTDSGNQGFSGFGGNNIKPLIPRSDMDNSNKPTLGIFLPYFGIGNTIYGSDYYLRFKNAIPVGQAAEINSNSFLFAGSISYVFDEIDVANGQSVSAQ